MFEVDSENVILWDVTPCSLIVCTNVSDELIHYILKVKSKYVFFRKVSKFLPGYTAYYSKAVSSDVQNSSTFAIHACTVLQVLVAASGKLG